MRLFKLVIFCCILLACNKGDFVITFFNINEDHTISLSQTLSSTGGNLVFLIETNQELKCDNLTLNHLINQNDESVTLWLNGYDNTKKCSNIPGIVKTNIPLKSFNNNLGLKILLKYESVIEKNGTLRVDDGQFSFNVDNDFGITSRNNAIRLVEANTYWGQIWSTDEKYLLNGIQLEALLNRHNLVELPVGNYSFFTINNVGLSIEDQSKKNNNIQFAGKFSKANFTQFINELNSIPNSKYLIRSYDDKYYER